MTKTYVFLKNTELLNKGMHLLNEEMIIDLDNDCFLDCPIELQQKINASNIISNQIIPARSAFILINEDNQACLASPLPCFADHHDNDGVKGSFCRHVLSLIDLHDMKDKNGEEVVKFPLFYKSSELKNMRSMDKSDYYKQSVLKEVIPENDIHFVDIDDICNQVIEETGMKHLILILDFCRNNDLGRVLITSNTLEKDDAIAITKAKLSNPYYTRTPSVTKESKELYDKFGNHVFEIPKREYQLDVNTKIKYKYDLSDRHFWELMRLSIGLREKIEEKCTDENDKAIFQSIKDMSKNMSRLHYANFLRFFLNTFVNSKSNDELVDIIKKGGE